jgi:hypothetical protein
MSPPRANDDINKLQNNSLIVLNTALNIFDEQSSGRHEASNSNTGAGADVSADASAYASADASTHIEQLKAENARLKHMCEVYKREALAAGVRNNKLKKKIAKKRDIHQYKRKRRREIYNKIVEEVKSIFAENETLTAEIELKNKELLHFKKAHKFLVKNLDNAHKG